jgi:hypothetical protein
MESKGRLVRGLVEELFGALGREMNPKPLSVMRLMVPLVDM